MAHFAELDNNNVVLRVIVVDNKDTHDINGIESEEIGIAFCKKVFGINTNWKQTSYNSTFRKNYANVGDKYYAEYDVFLPQQPYPSWTLNTASLEWEAPVPRPMGIENTVYIWNEETKTWDEQLIDLHP